MTADARRWWAIVNPAAGRGAGARIATTLAATFAQAAISLDVTRTTARGEAIALARAAAQEGRDVVLAVGGDGTANEVANGILDTTAALAFYPIGTGNDVARNLGYPAALADIPAFLASARPRAIDVGTANGRAFINHVGVGIDGVVAERVGAYRGFLGSTLAYYVSSLSAILTFRPVEMRVSLDGRREDGRYLVVVASNGVYFGSGMMVAPRAALDDGALDVTLAGELSIPGAVRALQRMYRGTHVDGRLVRAARARSVEIELAAPLPVDIDGELSRTTRVSVGVRPGALIVLG